MRRAFLERAVVELVYKFDEKSYCECLNGESISKVRFKYFFVHKHMDTTTDHFTPLELRVRGKKEYTICLYTGRLKGSSL